MVSVSFKTSVLCFFCVIFCVARHIFAVYSRFVVRLASRSKAQTIVEQARAIQDLLLASNPVDGLGGKWVLRRQSPRTSSNLDITGPYDTLSAATSASGEIPKVNHMAAPLIPGTVTPDTSAAFRKPPNAVENGAAAAALAFSEPAGGKTRVPMLNYTRNRILAFQHAVMNMASEGSVMPMDTQVRMLARKVMLENRHK